MDDIFISEASDNVNYCIDISDVTEELVSESFAPGCAFDEPGNIAEFDRSINCLF